MHNKTIFFILALICTSTIGLAEDSAAYSLGTMQPISTYVSSPGKSLDVEFYIFNAYGNRISHVNLAVGSNPDNLEIILPEIQTNRWNISGIITSVTEHLYVEPMPIVLEKPENPPEGIYYLKSTNVTGFIPAKRITATVKMPDDAQLGSTYEFTIMANAQWFGEVGTVQVSQSRPFTFKVRVLTENYTEALVVPEQPSEGGLGLSNEMVFGIVIAVLVLVVLYQQFRPKGRR